MAVFWEHAVRRNDIEAVRDLLTRGIDPNARDPKGQTGVMLAAQAGHVAVVQLLIDSGADLNLTGKHGLSAVMLAVLAGHKEVAQALAHAGADLTLQVTGALGFAGMTVVDFAAARGWNDLAIELAPENQAGGESRPFKTETSSFVQGVDLFVFAVATKARPVEDGRQQAFEQGKMKLINFSQITSLEVQSLIIEKPNPEGTVTIHHLLRVPAAKRGTIRGRLNEQARAQEQ